MKLERMLSIITYLLNHEKVRARELADRKTLKKDGELNEKYPDGIDGQKMLLEMEGHTRVKGIL